MEKRSRLYSELLHIPDYEEVTDVSTDSSRHNIPEDVHWVLGLFDTAGLSGEKERERESDEE